MSKVFGFNLSVDMEPLEVNGSYDPEQQVWVNESGVVAYTYHQTGTDLIQHSTGQEGTYTNGDLDHDWVFDNDYGDSDTDRD